MPCCNRPSSLASPSWLLTPRQWTTCLGCRLTRWPNLGGIATLGSISTLCLGPRFAPCTRVLQQYLLGDLALSDLLGLGLGLLSPLSHKTTKFACILAARGHWALLWATQQDAHYTWSDHDGLPDHLRDEAFLLAKKLTGLLSGDTICSVML